MRTAQSFRNERVVFGAELPAQPEVSEHKTPVPNGEIIEMRAGVTQNDEFYIIELVLFPTPLSPERRDAMYESGKKFMQQQNPRKLTSEEKTTIDGQESRRYVLESNDGQRVTEHQTVIIGNEVFQFIYERLAGHPSSAAAKTFFFTSGLKKG